MRSSSSKQIPKNYQESFISPSTKWILGLIVTLLIGGIIIFNLRKDDLHNESNSASEPSSTSSNFLNNNNSSVSNGSTGLDVGDNSSNSPTPSKNSGSQKENSSNNASSQQTQTVVETRNITETIYIEDTDDVSFNYDSNTVKVKDGQMRCIKDDRILQWQEGKKEWECRKPTSAVFGDLDKNSVNVNDSGELECKNDGDSLYWEGGNDQWACGDVSGMSTVTAGSGVNLNDSSLSIDAPTCNGTDKLQWNGTAFVCSADVDTDDQTLSFDSGTGEITISSGNTIDLSSLSLNHNDLNNIQGGTTNEYYHLTSTEYTDLNTFLGYTALPDTDGTSGQVLKTNGSGVLTWQDDDNSGSTITSVFTRTGAITAQANDYTWAQIDKTTSDIADITNRSHTDLTDIGTNTHATIDTHIANITTNPHSVDQSDVGLGNVDNTSDLNKPISTATQTALDLKADANNVLELDNTTLFTPDADYEPATKKYVDDNAGGTLHASLTDTDTEGHPYSAIELDSSKQIGSPTTVTTLDKAYDYIWSAGLYEGFELTDNGDGTVNIAAGEGVLRTSASPTAPLHLITAPAVNNLALTDNSANYIYVDYNAGSPTIAVGTSTTDFNCLDKCILYRLSREGNEINYINAMDNNVDANRSYRRKDFEIGGVDIGSGAKVSETGTRNLGITAGSFWAILSNITTSAFDTSVSDTFDLYYRNGSGGWTKTTGNTQVDNLYWDDGTGVLNDLAVNRYAARFVFMALSESGSKPVVIYGQNEHTTEEEAVNEQVPGDLPPEIDAVGAILAATIVQEGTTNFTSVLNVSETTFSTSLPTTHNNLSGLQGGTTNEYYHLTSAQTTNLTGFSDAVALPSADGTTGQVLQTNGTGTVSWATASGATTFLGLTDTMGGFTNGSVLFTSGSAVTEDNANLFWDDTNDRLGIGTTTPLDSLHVVDGFNLEHLATEADDHAFEVDLDAAGFGDVKAVDVIYDTGTITTGENEGVILVNIDESEATGGDVMGLEILATEGSANIYGMEAGVGVNPVLQLSGAFANMDSALSNAANVLTEFTTSDPGGVNNIDIFSNNNDTVTLGDASKFEEIEFLLETEASSGGIQPTFEYSTGVGTWATFTPVDGTNGLRNSGVIAWLDSDVPSWSTGTGSEYLIRITRTRSSLPTIPRENKVQIASAIQYEWDKNGDLFVKTVQSSTLLGGAVNLTTDVNGNIIRDPSDIKLKRNIETLENSLDKVLKLRGVSYEWKDASRFGDQTEIGFIAQEVQEVLPEVIRADGEYLAMNTRNILGVVVEAIKEMWNKVENNDERIEKLEKDNELLKVENNLIKLEMCQKDNTYSWCDSY